MKGNSKTLFKQVEQEEQLYERIQKKEEKDRQIMQTWIDKNKARASMATRVQSRVKSLARKDEMAALIDEKESVFNFQYKPFKGKLTLLSLEKVDFAYPKCQKLLKMFSVAIANGEKVGIIGKNGAGKSTLIKLMAGINKPQKGKVIYNEKCRFGYFGQTNIEVLDGGKSIYDTLASFLPTGNQKEVHALAALVCFGEDELEKKVKVLSGGEKARISFAKLMCESVNMLLCDEPTNHLDMYTAESLIEALKSFQGAVVVVSHDEGLLLEVCEKLVVFDQGQIKIYNKTYDQFLKEVGWAHEK